MYLFDVVNVFPVTLSIVTQRGGNQFFGITRNG